MILLRKKGYNDYKSEREKYLPGKRPVLDLCPATNLTGLEIIAACEIVHYSACTSVLKQRAALTGATKSRETYFILPELSEVFSSVTYPALYTFLVSEHVVFCSEKGP